MGRWRWPRLSRYSSGMDGGWSQISSTSSSCSAVSKKGNSTFVLSALMMQCIFLEGYQTGILPRRAPGVRLGGEERMCVRSSCVSFESLSRRVYAKSAIPSSSLIMVSPTSNDRMNIFLKRNTGVHPRPSLFLFGSTSCAKPTSRKRQSQVQSVYVYRLDEGLALSGRKIGVDGSTALQVLLRRS